MRCQSQPHLVTRVRPLPVRRSSICKLPVRLIARTLRCTARTLFYKTAASDAPHCKSGWNRIPPFLLRRRTHLPSSDGRALAGSLLFLPLFFGLNLLLLLDCGLLCFGRARRGHWGGSFMRQTLPHPCHLKKRCPAARAGRVGMGNPLALLCEAPIMVRCVSHERCSTACK